MKQENKECCQNKILMEQIRIAVMEDEKFLAKIKIGIFKNFILILFSKIRMLKRYFDNCI